MTTFVGFSTQHSDSIRTMSVAKGVDGGAGAQMTSQRSGRKFRITDEELVIQNLMNAFNIGQGQKPGKPDYGTNIWSFIFEPNTTGLQGEIEAEVRRVASLDPRLIVNSVTTSHQDHGILLEVELAVSPFNNANTLSILFDQNSAKATLV